MTCPECLRALQIAVHRAFAFDCIGCSIRELAYLDADSREVELDKLERGCGPLARAEAVRLLRLEMARIKSLRGEQVWLEQ